MRRRAGRGFVAPLLALAALALAPPSSALAQGGPPVSQAAPPIGYLQPGDRIRVDLWQEAELSGEFQIDETGVVALPLLGVRQVTRLPADQVKRQLVQEYARQLRNQPAHVTLLRRVRILGAVGNPGLYHVDPTLGLGDVIALAGGVRDDGDGDDVRVTRGRRILRASVERGLGVTWVESGDEIFVPRRSWIERNTTWLLGAVISAATLIVTRR